jgi:LVIVD repeat
MKKMQRQTAVRRSSLYRAPLFIALFSILVPGRLVALDLDLMRVGGYDTSGTAFGVAVSGNYAYVADADAGLQVIDINNPANPQRVGGFDASISELSPVVSALLWRG